MSTLWIFGDSFGECFSVSGEIINKQWHVRLAQELGLLYQNRALSGTGIEYCSRVWYDALSSMEEGDLAVIAVTETSRRWLVEDPPWVSTLARAFWGFYDDVVPSHVSKAVKKYFKHLYHPGAEESGLYNWACALNHVAITKNIKTILLPCFSTSGMFLSKWHDQFSGLHIAHGDLATIADREHIPELRGYIAKQCGRANHLTFPNHQILLDKLLAYHRDSMAVDLTYGFYENLINTRNLDDRSLFMTTHQIVPSM